jgi:hypothetical protein
MGDGDVEVSDDDEDDENSENIEGKLEGSSKKPDTPKDAPSQVPPSPIDPIKGPKDDASGPIKTDPSAEGEKAPLPGEAGVNVEANSDKDEKEPVRADGEVAKIVSLEKPSGKDKVAEAKTSQESAPTDPKKSFFAKARDFIVHKFKGNQEK